MGDMVKTIFSNFTEVITGLASGIKSAFMNIIYADPTAKTLVLSDVAKFGLIMVGITLATGLVMGALHYIRAMKG